MLFDEIPIHVINLARRTDRRTQMIKKLQMQKITNYQFVEAVPGETLNIDEMESQGQINFSHRRLRPNEYGCYLSHIKCYEKILSGTQEFQLILEDDAYFVKDLKEKLNAILNQVKNIEWDIFYLGINCYWEECKQGTYVTENIYFPNEYIWGTHAYLIKKDFLERKFNELFPIILPIDVVLMSLMNAKKLTLADTIIKVKQYGNDSDTK